MEKSVLNNSIIKEEGSTTTTSSAKVNNNKPPVYLNNPRPHLKRPLESNAFPPHHPLAGLPLPQSPTPYQQQQAARLQFYHTRPSAYVEKPSFGLNDFELQDTLGNLFILYISEILANFFSKGTGTFGRVYLSKFVPSSKYYAMKVLKKSEVVRLKQVEHLLSEKQILSSVRFPFIVDL